MKYSIVIPCYNESENLMDLVNVINSFPSDYDVEFILVENGSTDNSKQIFDNEIVENNLIKKVYVKENKGYGYGIIQGLKIASGDYVGWLHADLQYNPLDLKLYFDYINNHYNDRILLKGKRKNRKLVEYIFTFGMGIYDSILFKKRMSNVMAMPVIFNKELLNYIQLFPEDFSIDIFVYALAQKKKYKVIHLPIYLKDRQKGVSSWNVGFSTRIKQSIKMIKGSKQVKKVIKEVN